MSTSFKNVQSPVILLKYSVCYIKKSSTKRHISDSLIILCQMSHSWKNIFNWFWYVILHLFEYNIDKTSLNGTTLKL